jgi:hypothetical protein
VLVDATESEGEGSSRLLVVSRASDGRKKTYTATQRAYLEETQTENNTRGTQQPEKFGLV